MKRMTVPALLVTALLAFALAGCSQAQNMTEDTLKGVWKLDSASDLGIDAYANFGDDKAFEMILGDAWLDGTWTVSGPSGSITFTDYASMMGEESSSSSSSQKVAKISYINNKLVLGSNDSTKLVFVKDDSEEAKQMFSFGGDQFEGMVDSAGNPIEEVPEVIEDIPPITIADDDKVSIIVTGKGTDYTGDPCYRLSMTNKTDKDVYVVPDDTFKVGDKQVEAGLGDDLAAGETIETEMFFEKAELGGGLELLTSVDGVMVVCDNETDAEIAKYPFHAE